MTATLLTGESIPNVNVGLLKSLTDLKKYGIHPLSLTQIHDAPINELIKQIEDHGNIAFKLIYEAFNHPQSMFNIVLYRKCLACSRKYPSIHSRLSTNYKNILNKISILHLNQCNDRKFVNHVKKTCKNKQYRCILCKRGAAIFNLQYEISTSLWNCLNFVSNRLFFYCPLHMSANSINNNSDNNNPYYSRTNRLHLVKSMMTNHFICTVNNPHILLTVLLRKLCEYTMINVNNYQLIKAFECGTMVLENLTNVWQQALNVNNIEVALDATPNLNSYSNVKQLSLQLCYLFYDLNYNCKLYNVSNDQIQLFKKFIDQHKLFIKKLRELQKKKIDVTKKFKFFSTYKSLTMTFDKTGFKRIYPNAMDGDLKFIVNGGRSLSLWIDGLHPIVKLRCIHKLKKEMKNNDMLISRPTMVLNQSQGPNIVIKTDCISSCAPKYFDYYLFFHPRKNKSISTLRSIATGFTCEFDNLKDNICKLVQEFECSGCTISRKDYFNKLSQYKRDSFELCLFYAMILFNMKSCNGCKYFDHCLKIRPLNGYLHFQYSKYLYLVIKNYKQSYFHLKLAKKLDPNMIELNEIVAIVDNDSSGNTQITQYQQYLKLLYIKLNKEYKCDNLLCNKILKNSNKLCCKGCKCVWYCCKKCQKSDWQWRHRNKCISKYLQPLNTMESFCVQQAQFMLKQIIKGIPMFVKPASV